MLRKITGGAILAAVGCLVIGSYIYAYGLIPTLIMWAIAIVFIAAIATGMKLLLD